MKNKPLEFYLDWTNNYLTVEKMASDYGLTVDEARELIEEGNSIYLKQCLDRRRKRKPKLTGNPDYLKLSRHAGHNLEVAFYGWKDWQPESASIECLDCNEVLVSEDRIIEN